MYVFTYIIVASLDIIKSFGICFWLGLVLCSTQLTWHYHFVTSKT